LLSTESFQLIKKHLNPNIIVKILGPRNNGPALTANLFDALRWFDQQKVEIIYAESYRECNLGAALMNRLIKAAGGKRI